MKTITSILIVLMLLPALSFSQSGTLDSSFGKNGKTVKPKGFANAVVIQTDGKIIAGGSSHLASRLVRYNKSGSIDRTFGINGEVVVDSDISSTLHSIVLTVNNEILTAGSDSKDFELAKFKPNGSFDSSFGVNGKVSTNFFGQRDEAYSVVIQPDNKIIAIGIAFEQSGETTRMALARYNQDGTLDSSFNHSGKINKLLNDAHFDNGRAIILQPNGKIVAVGSSDWYIRGTDITLVRFTANGKIDKSFGVNGYTFTDFGGFDSPSDAATQSDGRIIVAGSVYSNTDGYKMLLARYTQNGKLDSTFGVNGIILTAFNSTGDWANGIAIQPDDKIVVTGAGGGIEVVRFKKNGLLDSSFGNNGAFIIDSTNSYESVIAVAIKKNGEIISAGDSSADDGYDNNYLVIRLNGEASKTNITADNYALKITRNNLSNLNIKLYPNPVKDVLHITGINKESTISVFDAEGKLLHQITAANKTYDLNIKQLPAGIYYLHIEENAFVNERGKKISNIKFIKQE